MTLPPNYGADYIRPFEQMYKELAAKYKLTFIPFLLVDIAKQLSTRRDLLNADGIHPTSAGNEIVAATVLKTLEPLLHH
jgi:acyl-CoA thioesterase-1